MRISPTINLDDIYGIHHYYSGVAPFTESLWLPAREMLNFRCGAELSVVNDMPYICHASVATERGLAILEGSGMPYASNLRVYDTPGDYACILDAIDKSGHSVVLKHVHPEVTIPPCRLWNARALTCALNNKKNLHRYVPEINLPVRDCVMVDKSSLQKVKLPVVVKAPVEWSTGSGSAVSICYTLEDLEQTTQRFSGCAELIFEEFLDIDRSYCVQFAAMPDGTMNYLGMTRQVTGSDGVFYGSWLEDPTDCLPQLEGIGSAVMQVAIDLGYRGVAGFDIAICKDGRILVIDLNFRVNGSTAALLLYRKMAKSMGSKVMRFTSWRGLQGFGAFERSTYQAIEDGKFLPLSVCDPENFSASEAYPMVSGVVAGDTKDEVLARIRELEKNGLDELKP